MQGFLMAYSAEISRTNPTCFLFLVDQSESMSDPFGGEAGNRKKSEGVADAINRLLQTLVLRCAKSEGVRDYFHVGVIGYGSRVGSAFGGALSGQRFVPISAIANQPLRVEQRMKKVDDGAGGLVEQSSKFPIWFEPVADGPTPMCEALRLAQGIVSEFISRAAHCFPPLIVNITDGEANDGNPEPVAEVIKQMGSSDGQALLFNAHLSSRRERPFEFPSVGDGLPDEFARMLFRMSSPLPERMCEVAQKEGLPVVAGSRGFVFNADLVSVIRFLDIGTRVDAKNLR
jgi:hypothetical protein